MAAWWTWPRLIAVALLFIAAGVAVPLLAAPGASSGSASGHSSIGFVRVDRPAPPLTLTSLTGHAQIGIASLAGEPIVVNFWSSTCEICKSETQALVRVADSTKGHVRFLGIDTLDLRTPALAFAARYKIPYALSFDPQGVVEARYRLPGLPMTFFLSPSGKRIIGINTGALTVGSLTAILHQLYGKSV